MQANFDPNKLSFDDCVQRLRAAAEKVGLDQKKEILTSRDKAVQDATRLLEVTNLPDSGFTKWQLPVFLDCKSQMFMTTAAPGIEAPEHSHDEGDGIRFIISGSIHYNGQELTEGDWMFIPAGARYSFQVGRMGACMCYCYCCCCA